MHYGPALTRAHDAGFTEHVRAAAPLVIERLAGSARDGLVVDLGCGGGVLSAALADAGYRVLGVDISPDMIELARERAPGAAFECASCFRVEIPPCVGVVSIGEVLSYAADECAGEDALRALFRRAHDALSPGGLLMFDLAEPGRCPDGERVRSWLERDWAMFARSTENRETRALRREIATFCRIDGAWTRSDETHLLRLYPREWIVSTLRECGFESEVLERYGAQEFPPGYGAHVARKR